MRTVGINFAKFLLFSLLLVSVSSVATTPPRAPNYCGPSVCLDISPSFGAVSVEATTPIPTKNSGVKLLVTAGSDSAEITVTNASQENCAPKAELIVKGVARLSKGRAWVKSPDEQSCSEVVLEYVRGIERPGLLQAGPITAIWLIDQTPTTYWKKGYSLRIGEELSIKYQLQKTRENQGSEK
jgi:hypothetical protein